MASKMQNEGGVDMIGMIFVDGDGSKVGRGED
jgi:hypothetical protein